MGFVLFLILVGVPILEIALFIQVGGAIGVWPTVAICIATAVAGSFLVRLQGLQVARQAQAKMERGEPPAGEMFHGICLLLAGFLLITPGFFTDAIGLLLLLPPVRVLVGALLWRQFEGRIRMQASGMGRTNGKVIDGEFEEVDGAKRPSGRGQAGRGQAGRGQASRGQTSRGPGGAAGDRPRLPPEGGTPNPSSPWRRGG